MYFKYAAKTQRMNYSGRTLSVKGSISR